MSYNFVKLKSAAGPLLVQNMSVFSFKILFANCRLLKVMEMWSFPPVSATGGHGHHTDVAAVKLIHFRMLVAAFWLLGSYHCLVNRTTSIVATSAIYRQFCPSKQHNARWHGRAELTCISCEQIWMICLQWKCFSSLLAYLQVLLVFFKRHPNTISEFLSILDIYDEK